MALLVTAVLFSGFCETMAQSGTTDVIYLKNGSAKKGQIVSIVQGEKIILQTTEGELLEIPESEVGRIMQGLPDSQAQTEKPAKLLKPRHHGLYNTTMLSFAMGAGPEGTGIALGAGASNVLGYQFSRALGVGVGFGVDNYARRGETIFPVFLELKSYFPSEKTTGGYYFSAAGGWGLAFNREELGIKEANGGYMVLPSVGYRALTNEGLDINIDLGIKVQKADFVRLRFNGDVEERDVLYRRLAIRVGLSFWK